jgi:hypothetical protein
MGGGGVRAKWYQMKRKYRGALTRFLAIRGRPLNQSDPKSQHYLRELIKEKGMRLRGKAIAAH